MSHPDAKGEDGLTVRQRRFVEEFPLDCNGSQACIRAGYSPIGAAKQAKKLLKIPAIKAAVQAALDARSDRLHFTADEVLLEIATLVRSDPRHFKVSKSGRLTLAPDAPDNAWRAVSRVKHKRRTIPQTGGAAPIVEHEVEFHLWDKGGAIEKAMRHLGIGTPELRFRDVTLEDYLRRRVAERGGQRAPMPVSTQAAIAEAIADVTDLRTNGNGDRH